MTVKELSQFYYLNQEIANKEKNLEILKSEIAQLEKKLTDLQSSIGDFPAQSIDDMPKSPSVSTSRVENAAIKIADLKRLISQKKELCEECLIIIQASKNDCVALRNELERYISRIDKSSMRLIVTYRFVDCLTWSDVADKLGANNTEDSVKKQFYRYLKKESKAAK